MEGHGYVSRKVLTGVGLIDNLLTGIILVPFLPLRGTGSTGG